ncbi:hypothetical protein GCM10009753_13420 [Streptantibioticus ferralitis]
MGPFRAERDEPSRATRQPHNARDTREVRAGRTPRRDRRQTRPSLASDSEGLPGITTPDRVNVVINIMSAILFLLVLCAALRAPRGRELLRPRDETSLRELLERHGGRDSLGHLALRRDKRVIWSSTRKSAIAYRAVGGVTLASGDPIGDPEAWPGAIEPWLEAREHGWIPAVMGASGEGGTIYARDGLDALQIGDEAIAEAAEFAVEGRAMRAVRQAYNRVRGCGHTVRNQRHEDIPEDESSDGPSLDLMCRDRAPDNGLFEYSAIELVRRAYQLGIRQLALNSAMFRPAFERGSWPGAGPVPLSRRSLLTSFSRRWRIESPYRTSALGQL